MKNKFALIFATVILATLMSCDKNKKTNDLYFIGDIPTVQAFSEEAIPQSDINKILKAGINSQSAMNSQPWHFSVITNKESMTLISDALKNNMPKKPAPDGKAPMPANGPKANVGDSPLAILISGKDGGEFDIGLAAQLMVCEAFELGYAVKIVSSPNIVLNGENQNEYKKIFDIPDDMSSKAMLLIGKYPDGKIDAITSASTRKDFSEVVSSIK